ncbi:MAG: hypothetical protein WCG47_16090 [Dermatophilaceae bacterium]
MLGTDEAAALPSPAVVLSARLNQDYTGVRVAELVAIRLERLTLTPPASGSPTARAAKTASCRYRRPSAKPWPCTSPTGPRPAGRFCSSRPGRKPYSTRGVRALLARYAAATGLPHNMPPHRLRHFLFTWPKTQGMTKPSAASRFTSAHIKIVPVWGR